MYDVLYEDDCLLVVNKPSAMLVIPAKNEKKLSLLELLNKQAKKDRLNYRLHPCHRIDRDTSGIVVFAKGKLNQSLIMEQFRKGEIKKKYLAFVKGIFRRRKGRLVNFVQAVGKRSGRKAVLYYRVLEERKSWSVVAVQPLTGRTHQIRIQFAMIGYPLLGERIYAFGRDFEVKFRRLALHAQEISFRHPQHNKSLFLGAPLPFDMRKFL